MSSRRPTEQNHRRHLPYVRNSSDLSAFRVCRHVGQAMVKPVAFMVLEQADDRAL